MEIVEVATRCADAAALEHIAASLVSERLAASAHEHGPISSVYRWNGEVVTTSEYKLDFNTTCEDADAVVSYLLALHPYDTAATVARAATVGNRYGTSMYAHTTSHK